MSETAQEKLEVVVAFYARTHTDHLAQALESLVLQSMPAESVCVVADGPVSDTQWQVIEQYATRLPLRLLTLPHNKGPGVARDRAIRSSDASLIAVMDSDDFSLPERFAEQRAAMAAHPEVCACGGFLAEATVPGASEQNWHGVREVALTYADLRQTVRYKNPCNNVTMMFRKTHYLQAGGFPALRFGEDWLLWARMLASDMHLLNLPKVLVVARTEAQFDQRRSGWPLWLNDFRIQRELLKLKLIGVTRAGYNLFLYGVFRLAPTFLRQFFYKSLLRKSKPCANSVTS